MAYTDIDKATDYFTTFLWTGDGASTRSITGVGLQADMMWSKIRNVGHQHNLVDTVRGVNQRLLMPNESGAEDTTGTQGYFNSLDSDGFSLTYGGAGGYNTNRSGEPYVGWFWKANGSGSSNTDGDITSTVSANTTSGFSIVSYTGNGTAGATVGHGLGVAPKMIIAKVRSTGEDWPVYHASLGATKYIKLSSTGASETETSIFNDTEPTSSVFSLGTQNKINMNTQTFIAYCFAEKKGFSKFGSYTGNGNDDGTFVYTGFRPAFVMVKCTSTTSTFTSWSMFDTSRSSYNVSAGNTLYANNSINEGYRGNGSTTSTTSPTMDLLSNGFKLRKNADETNASQTYIYMSFAENPFVTSTGIPTTAR